MERAGRHHHHRHGVAPLTGPIDASGHRGSEARPPADDDWGPPPADLVAIDLARREWRVRAAAAKAAADRRADAAPTATEAEAVVPAEDVAGGGQDVGAEPPPSLWRTLARVTAVTATSVVAIALLVVLATALGSGRRSPTTASTTTLPEPLITAEEGETIVAVAAGSSLELFDEPDGDAVAELASPTPVGAPLTMVVVPPVSGEWVEVVPPAADLTPRFVRADDVELSRHTLSLEIDLDAARLVLVDDGETVVDVPIVVGPEPPPAGSTYVTALVETPDPDGGYGADAFALAGQPFSLDAFATRTGLVGIHGGDGTVGSVALAPDDLAQLVGIVALGTPVEVVS